MSTVAGITVAESLRSAVTALAACSDSPRLDAEVLLAGLLGATRTALLLRADEALLPGTERAYLELIGRRADGMPVAYLTGVREFWSLPLKVTPAVLVPRPETELLVEHALQLLPLEDAGRSLLDLGTGSGAIALAVALERPRTRVLGVELSEAACRVARDNADALGLGRIEWRVGSWFAAVASERFDVIVSNPPYVAAGDPALAALGAEPALALVAGPSGLEMLSAIVAGAPAQLTPGGWLLVEHGATQASAVAALFRQHHFEQIRSHEDYAGRPRLTRGRHSGSL
ncbi:MAG TPA: peptide chain release factor N(5)-glutamine methyltransferase [Steroidobacteraceae bacterium]|nr:peptide chain release factor N(5)-glutamine methyltransferase [Steroidobacteraceae bacterium]